MKSRLAEQKIGLRLSEAALDFLALEIFRCVPATGVPSGSIQDNYILRLISPTYLEDYFLFLCEDDIRIKGRRLGIDNVLFYFKEG